MESCQYDLSRAGDQLAIRNMQILLLSEEDEVVDHKFSTSSRIAVTAEFDWVPRRLFPAGTCPLVSAAVESVSHAYGLRQMPKANLG